MPSISASLQDIGFSLQDSAPVEITTKLGEIGQCTVQSLNPITAGKKIGIFWNGTRIFGGPADTVDMKRKGGVDSTITEYTAHCYGWEYRFSKRFITYAKYTGTGGDIFQAVLDDWAVGEPYNIVSGNIETGAPAEDMGVYIIENKYVGEVLNDIAVRSKAIWWIDPETNIYLKTKPDITPIDIEINPTNQNYSEPVLSQTHDRYYNSVSIEIPWELYQPEEENFTGDGSTQLFTVTRDIHHISTIELNGVPSTSIGVFGVDTPGDFDWYYEPGTGNIHQDTGLPALTAADTLVVRYFYGGQNVFQYTDIDEKNAVQTNEDGAGIYHAHLTDPDSKDYNSSVAKALAFLDLHEPSAQGADLGTLPRIYNFTFQSYNDAASHLQLGKVFNLTWTNPDSGGSKALLVAAIRYKYIHSTDRPNVGGTEGHFQMEVTAYEYSSGFSFVDLFDNPGGGSSGFTSSPNTRNVGPFQIEFGFGIGGVPQVDDRTPPKPIASNGIIRKVFVECFTWPTGASLGHTFSAEVFKKAAGSGTWVSAGSMHILDGTTDQVVITPWGDTGLSVAVGDALYAVATQVGATEPGEDVVFNAILEQR